MITKNSLPQALSKISSRKSLFVKTLILFALFSIFQKLGAQTTAHTKQSKKELVETVDIPSVPPHSVCKRVTHAPANIIDRIDISDRDIQYMYDELMNGRFSMTIDGVEYASNNMEPVTNVYAPDFRETVFLGNSQKKVIFYNNGKDFTVHHDDNGIITHVSWIDETGEKIDASVMNSTIDNTRIIQLPAKPHHIFTGTDGNGNEMKVINNAGEKKPHPTLVFTINMPRKTIQGQKNTHSSTIAVTSQPRRDDSHDIESREPTQTCTHEVAVYYDISYDNNHSDPASDIIILLNTAQGWYDNEFNNCSIDYVLSETQHSADGTNEKFTIDFNDIGQTLDNFRAWGEGGSGGNGNRTDFSVTRTLLTYNSFSTASGLAYEGSSTNPNNCNEYSYNVVSEEESNPPIETTAYVLAHENGHLDGGVHPSDNGVRVMSPSGTWQNTIRKTNNPNNQGEVDGAIQTNIDWGCYLPTSQPLELVSFDAGTNGDCVTTLTRNTEMEINVKHIVIEKSIDGIAFVPQDTIAPKGAHSHYEYKIPDNNGRESFYRLKIDDMDGSWEYSDTEHVPACHTDNSVYVYPNPTDGVLHIVGGKTCRILNAQGQTVLEGPTDKVNTSDLPSGLYLIKVRDDVGHITTIKVTKS